MAIRAIAVRARCNIYMLASRGVGNLLAESSCTRCFIHREKHRKFSCAIWEALGEDMLRSNSGRLESEWAPHVSTRRSLHAAGYSV